MSALGSVISTYIIGRYNPSVRIFDLVSHTAYMCVRTPENIAAVAEILCEVPSISIHRRSQQFNFSETSLRRILQKTLV